MQTFPDFAHLKLGAPALISEVLFTAQSMWLSIYLISVWILYLSN